MNRRNVNAERFTNCRQTVQTSSNSNSVHSSYNNAKVFSDDNLTAHSSTDRYAMRNNVQKVTETGDDHTMQVVENEKEQVIDQNKVYNLFLNIYLRLKTKIFII